MYQSRNVEFFFQEDETYGILESAESRELSLKMNWIRFDKVNARQRELSVDFYLYASIQIQSTYIERSIQFVYPC